LQDQLHQSLLRRFYLFHHLKHLSLLAYLHTHRLVPSFNVMVLLMSVNMFKFQIPLLRILMIYLKTLPLLFLVIQIMLCFHLILLLIYLFLLIKVNSLLLIASYL
jgi:hypothetical protein